ncbi:MAG: hypothetical protein ABSB36_07145 [Candidatus Dormibacteria bacterium]|jgi:hypothetical protein
MSGVRRATVTAQSDDLAVLADDARRRDISLSTALGELVLARAAQLRQQRRPRLGTFRSGSTVGIAVLMESNPDAPAAQPFRS